MIVRGVKMEEGKEYRIEVFNNRYTVRVVSIDREKYISGYFSNLNNKWEGNGEINADAIVSIKHMHLSTALKMFLDSESVIW